MAAVLVPDAAGPLAADHARTDRRVGDAGLAEERAPIRRRQPRHDVAADTLTDERRRRVRPEAGQVDGEAPPRVEVSELVAKPQVAVRDVGDAAPVATRRAEDAPQLLLGPGVALA